MGKSELQALRRIEQKIDILLDAQGVEFIMEAMQMADLSALQSEVQQNGDVVQSAITLLQGLSQQLSDAAASNDPAAVQAIVDQLDTQTQQLADAVAANTPADPSGGGLNPPNQ